MPKRLLIVDDDARFRELLRMVLENAPQFDVVGEAQEGAEALAATRALDPDVVLLDVNLPDAVGFDLVPALAGGDGRRHVVMTSSRGDSTYVELAQQAGASGFVPKHELSAAAIERALA
jgi:DNA-binding NarL/FixJ family response regulator